MTRAITIPDGTFKTCKRNKFTKTIVTLTWYSNDLFHYMFKAEFVALVSLKVPSGTEMEHVIRIPRNRHNCFRKFAMLASLKVPSGIQYLVSRRWTYLLVHI